MADDGTINLNDLPDDANWMVGEPTVGETKRIITDAVGHIRQLLGGNSQGRLEAALEIGTYLLEKFFGGDPDNYRKNVRSSGLFLALLADPGLDELDLTQKTIQNYIRVAIVSKHIPLEAESLGLSQRIKLLSIYENTKLVAALAVEAVKSDWSARRLEVEVASARSKGTASSTGKEPSPKKPKPKPTIAVTAVSEIRKLVSNLPEAIDESVPEGSGDVLKQRDFIEFLTAMHDLLQLADSLEDGAEAIAKRLGTSKLAPKYPPDSTERVADLGVLKGFIDSDEAAKLPVVLSQPDPTDTIRALRRSGAKLTAAFHRGRCSQVDAWIKSFTEQLRSQLAPTAATQAQRARPVGTSFTDHYRPRRFRDIVGSPGAVATLKGYAKEQIHKPFLVHGRPGTGKTSLAWVYAQAFLCDARDDEVEPCGVCSVCREIETGVMDFPSSVIELSSAAATEAKKAAETTLDFLHGPRMLIVNEADKLLSKQARLLRELENLKGTTVLFCTTKPEAFDEQFRSRCTEIEVHPLLEAEMLDYLGKIAEAEGVPIKQDQLKDLLTRLEPHDRRGQIRDALNILEAEILRRSV